MTETPISEYESCLEDYERCLEEYYSELLTKGFEGGNFADMDQFMNELSLLLVSDAEKDTQALLGLFRENGSQVTINA